MKKNMAALMGEMANYDIQLIGAGWKINGFFLVTGVQ